MRHALLHVSNNPMLKFHFAFRRKSQVPSTLADSQQLYSVQTVMVAQLTLIGATTMTLLRCINIIIWRILGCFPNYFILSENH